MQPFKPEITRIKLNPEQAVLVCSCYDTGWKNAPDQDDPFSVTYTVCPGMTKDHEWPIRYEDPPSSSSVS